SRATDGVDEDEVANPVGKVMRQLYGHAAAKRVPDQEHGLGDAHGGEEVGRPGGVAGDGAVAAGKVGGAAETGKGGRQHLTAEVSQTLQRPLVGVLADTPAMEEQHWDALTGNSVHRRMATHGGALPVEMVL